MKRIYLTPLSEQLSCELYGKLLADSNEGFDNDPFNPGLTSFDDFTL